jgi:hypothetical protein
MGLASRTREARLAKMKLGSDMSGTLTPKATSAELGPLID